MMILTEKKLAQKLGLSYWTIRGWRLQLGLPHIKTAGRIFYRLESVEKWMEEEEQANRQEVTESKSKII